MKWQSLIAVAVVLLCVVAVESSNDNLLDTVVPQDMFLGVRKFFLDLFGRTATSKRHLGRAKFMKKLQGEVKTAFPCKVEDYTSPVVPDSVDRLMPGDISVIAALGDSLTAGNGAAASNLVHVYTENRGISWSIGGQGTWREYLTLPNILKMFNPKLVGYATGDSLSTDPDSQFNVAELGAMSQDLPFMAKELVKRIKNDPRVRVNKDWKVVTIMIGSNDFCLEICFVDADKEPARHRRELMETLDILQKELPRTFVNLVLSPDVMRALHSFKKLKSVCWLTHHVECPCMFGARFEHKKDYYSSIIRRWQEVEWEVAANPKYQTKDFAVVLQPFTQNVTFPKLPNGATDSTLLSEDCFHFSQKGYARGANALWNNMMEAVGKKSTNWRREFEMFLCPSPEDPFIKTVRNSRRE